MANPRDSGLLAHMKELNRLSGRSQTGEFLHGRPDLGQRILVVEKDSDHHQLAKDVLEDAGYQVKTAANGAVAWAALQRHRYDLIITDQFLPKVSRVALVKKLYAAGITVPVIMATEILPTWEFALHPCLQAVTMLRKPYAIDQLPAMVKRCLQENIHPKIVAVAAPQNQPLSACLRLKPSEQRSGINPTQ
jgi:DNA-binding NtrC family response regulator